VLNNDSIEPFYISENPITNREYLTYLCWLADVYRDYPKILLNAFPYFDKNQIESLINNGFTPIQIRTLVESSYFVEHYMFNPKYIDYPVLGLNWGQSMNFLNWLSDRYNEYLLIDKRIQNLDLNQYRENSFNTEAYLANQYEGLIREALWNQETNQIRGVEWKDRLLVPSFRLPSKEEINIERQLINSSLKDYKPNKFLRPWTKHYIEINKDQLILRIEGENHLLFSFNKNVTERPEYHETFILKPELSLDQMFDGEQNSILRIFADLNQNEVRIEKLDGIIRKDSLGHMPFVILSEDDNLNPVFIERNDYSNYDSSSRYKKKEFSLFRYALCGIKK